MKKRCTFYIENEVYEAMLKKLRDILYHKGISISASSTVNELLKVFNDTDLNEIQLAQTVNDSDQLLI